MIELSRIELYHIVNIDRLPSILSMGALCSDVDLKKVGINCGTSIAYEHIRERRRTMRIDSYPDLTIGSCVPFYFGKHSPMLYRAMMGPTVGYDYTGGQDPIVYLVFMLSALVDWAANNGTRWIFTDRNASDYLAQQFNKLEDLDKLSWGVIRNKMWKGHSDIKAAEFLVEHRVPISDCLFGVATRTEAIRFDVEQLFKIHHLEKPVKLHPEWFF